MSDDFKEIAEQIDEEWYRADALLKLRYDERLVDLKLQLSALAGEYETLSFPRSKMAEMSNWDNFKIARFRHFPMKVVYKAYNAPLAPKRQVKYPSIYLDYIHYKMAQIAKESLKKPAITPLFIKQVTAPKPVPSVKLQNVDIEPSGYVKVHVRTKRKQWGGKPTTYTPELNVRRTLGYVLRSLRRTYPTAELMHNKPKRDFETIRRSLSHTLVRVKVEPIYNVNEFKDVSYIEASRDYGSALWEQLTKKMRNAYMDVMDGGSEAYQNMCEQFYLQNADRPIFAFSRMQDYVDAQLTEEWENYNDASMVSRARAVGKELDSASVKALPDADLSYLDD